ncbi:MAG: hypothetical protein ACRDU9_07560 [Acidimicrobiia bacterium]
MRFLSRRALLAVVAGLVLFGVPAPVLAAETSNAEFVIIPEDDVFPDDLYAGAIRVVVEGTIEGDLIAFAAEEIVINGTVTGSVIALTPRITVNGEIGDSLRVSANRLTITGEVAGDVVAAVFDAEVSSSSRVAGDLLLWAWNADLRGEIGADLTGTQRSLELAGAISGDVDISTSRLTVVERLTVGGDLGYRSGREAEGLGLGEVAGAVVHKTPLPPNLRVRALGLLGRFMVVLFLSVAALSAAYGWPRRTGRAVAEVGRTPLRKWLTGALVLSSPLLAMLVTGLVLGLAPPAAAFPLLAVLAPLVVALVGLAFGLALVAGAPIVGWLGGVVFRSFDLYAAILAGSIIVGIVWYLPWVGWLVPLVVLPLGLGAWMATWRTQPDDAV